MTTYEEEDFTKYKKVELVKLVEELFVEKRLLEEKLARVTKQYNQLHSKATGKIGFKAGVGRKNPLVD